MRLFSKRHNFHSLLAGGMGGVGEIEVGDPSTTCEDHSCIPDETGQCAIKMITEEQGVVDTTAALPMSQFTAINRTEQRAMVILDAVDETSYEWPKMSPPEPETLNIPNTMSQSISAAPNWYKQSSSSTHASTKSPQGWERFDLSSANSSCHQAKLLSPKQTPTYGPDGPGKFDQSYQRKRPFMHRSRTGCMTCRRRRKKCDEKRPECKSL